MSTHPFNHEQALEFFRLYPDSIDTLQGPDRKTAFAAAIKSLAPLVRLMLRDPAIESDPESEGRRVGNLLWVNGIQEIARQRAQNHYVRTFLNFAKIAEKSGRVKDGKFYRAVAEGCRDPDKDEWVVVEEDDVDPIVYGDVGRGWMK